MYAGRVACCPMVSHVEYTTRALLRLEKRRDTLLTLEKKIRQRERDGRTPVRYIMLIGRRGLRNNNIRLAILK